MKKLDIDKIVDANTWRMDAASELEFTRTNFRVGIKQAIREVLPNILEYVSEIAKTKDEKAFFHDIEEWGYEKIIDKKSIISLEKEILNKLEI